jgi:hypothetical protein
MAIFSLQSQEKGFRAQIFLETSLKRGDAKFFILAPKLNFNSASKMSESWISNIPVIDISVTLDILPAATLIFCATAKLYLPICPAKEGAREAWRMWEQERSREEGRVTSPRGCSEPRRGRVKPGMTWENLFYDRPRVRIMKVS